MKPTLVENKIQLLNIALANITADQLLKEVTSGTIFPMNVDTLVTLQKDEGYYKACSTASYLTVDSQIILFLLRIFGNNIKEKIAGSDFFPAFCKYHKDSGNIRIFVLGGLGNVATRVQKILNTDAGRMIVVGAYSPSYGFDTNPSECENIVHRINDSGATVLAVGVGAPRQEKWIHQYRHALPNIKLFMAVGATLDFIAGTQRRAPKWMQNSGLEWLFRLVLHPKRLAGRYLLRDAKFFYYFLLQRTKRYKNPFGV
jgi:N-acetylglucosaminyldiphosphoundecaprenol N-acetyl-beta-D-mannosaminyltransferase